MEKTNNIDIIEVETPENSKTILTADNGSEINQIKYSSNSKYFVTHNAKNKSIIGWSVGIDEKTIEQDKYLKYSKNGFLEDSDQFIGITVDGDDDDFGKKQDSSSDESIDVTIEDVSDDKYILVSNHFENKSYYKLLDFSKKNVNYFEINHKMDITFDQGYFFGNNKIIMGKLEEDYYEIHLFTYDSNSKNNPVVHKATRRLYNICNPDFFSTLDNNLLIACNGILLSEWKLQWNNGTFLRKKDHYLLLRYDNIYFNKNNLLMVTYNKSDSKLLVHSLKDDVVISSSKLEENIDIKKLDFYTKDQLEFLLVIYSKHNAKNYQCQLMDPYNLDNVNDVTKYFNEYIIENTTEDILFGRVLLDNKITMIINDQLLTKEFINEEKLEKLKKHREQIQKTPKTTVKKSLLRNLILPLKTLYRNSRLFETSERIFVKGKDTQWLIEYEEKFKNIKVKIPKFYNKSRKNLITIDDDETFEDYGLLYNDDLILLTKKFKRRYRSKGIHILSFNTQNKIYTKYVGYVNYVDNKELIEKIKQVFNSIGDSYIDKEQLKGKTFEEMIPYMLEDLYYFSRHGDKVLKFALRSNDIVIVEQIFDSCLNWFKKEASSNHSLLKIIISNLSELKKKKYQHLLSKFFIQTSMLLDPSCNSITISEVPSTEILQLEIDKKKKKGRFLAAHNDVDL